MAAGGRMYVRPTVSARLHHKHFLRSFMTRLTNGFGCARAFRKIQERRAEGACSRWNAEQHPFFFQRILHYCKPWMGYKFSANGRIGYINESTIYPEDGRALCFELQEGENTMDWSFGSYKSTNRSSLQPSIMDAPLSVYSNSPSLVSSTAPSWSNHPSYHPSLSPTVTWNPTTGNPTARPLLRPVLMPLGIPSFVSSHVPSVRLTVNPTYNPVTHHPVTLIEWCPIHWLILQQL